MVVMRRNSVWRSNPNRYSRNADYVTIGTAKAMPMLNAVQSYQCIEQSPYRPLRCAR